MTPKQSLHRKLWIILVVAVVSTSTTGIYFARVSEQLGIGRYRVAVELADGAGLYTGANVTYRGSEIGRVVELTSHGDGARAVLSLESDVAVPADTEADVHSMSAIGEQYIDIVPDSSDGPYLSDGSVISRDRTSVPDQVGPTIDLLQTALASIGSDNLRSVLDESAAALGNNGTNVAELLDSFRTLSADANADAASITGLIDNADPVLTTAAASSESIRAWAASLTGVTGELRDRDASIRSLIDKGTPMATEVTALFQQLQPTLPLLLANLTTVEQVAVVYNPSIEQILVLYPPLIAATQGTGMLNSQSGEPGQNTYFAAQVNDPPPCTTGFLPASERRSPTEIDTIPTPGGLYCKVDPADPTAIRGARNLPCMEFPGRRAATVELCRDPVASTGEYDTTDSSYIARDGRRYVDENLDTTTQTLDGLLVPGGG
ncbi:Mce family protein [Rhodococcus sp. 14-2483-1-1]|uniref:MCE family protein n=1 Tax=Rhodococcus sp. 14-2483-1-1 TaxID=2023148 RepID=UPI000B9C159E|nr:MlaD family protein [Rhodococcus sp. 14-2483-1-1]OZF40970.1 Mce family protein [Rhodococcus sp. 14-2483-1-1]